MGALTNKLFSSRYEEKRMDTLHTMLRSLKGERKSQPDRSTAFRELLDQLDRIGRRAPPHRNAATKRKASVKRSRKG